MVEILDVIDNRMHGCYSYQWFTAMKSVYHLVVFILYHAMRQSAMWQIVAPGPTVELVQLEFKLVELHFLPEIFTADSQ